MIDRYSGQLRMTSARRFGFVFVYVVTLLFALGGFVAVVVGAVMWATGTTVR
jgi:hypothetical protein